MITPLNKLDKSAIRIFDIKIEGERIRAALTNIKDTQQPGQAGNKGTKTEVLSSVKDDILKIVAEGYTVRQIADAISKDVFGILPKTITQLIKKQPDIKLKTKRIHNTDAQKSTTTSSENRLPTRNTNLTNIRDIEDVE